ncbi:MAG: CxxxxCH/CxxCH domain-containing protein [Thermodesulfobacteriota bacterium]
MAGKPYLRRGRTWAARVAYAAGVALVTGAGGAGAATHYPPGAICYDCHAVSKSKMVLGTHLLKKSDRTVALGISASNPQAPCLFCHDKNAAPSVLNRDRMKGVWDHFDASSTSKHPSDIQSGFGGNATALDCLDCHAHITAGVESDGSGNASVHGIDAGGGTRLNLYASLIGAPDDASQVSDNTCRNAACHSDTGSSTGGYTAPAAHGMGRATINDGAAPTSCTQCHGSHNSYQNTSLVTLRTDGTTSNNPGDPLGTRVTPEKCGECHVQDDAGVYAAKGHGQSTISSGTLGCTACHSGSVPHDFARSAPGTNPLRFAFAENTSVQSAIRQQAPYNQAYSVCLTCHSQYTGKLHGGTTAKAGCNDCHEPHGAGVAPNVAMVRVEIPKVDAAGTPVYGDGTASAPYDTNAYLAYDDTTYKTDGTGLCDNRECHQGRVVAGDEIYPLSTFLTGGRHSGGDVATGGDFVCQVCHTHTDEGGSWGAKASCTTCHGQPPVSTATTSEGYTRFSEAASPHRRHAAPVDQGGYGYACQTCHLDYTSSATHNTDPKTYQSLNFDTAANPSGTYDVGAATCNNLYCHSDGQSGASVGSVQWMSGFATPDWSTQNLACNACHGGVDEPTRIATGNHPIHLAWAGITCAHCHNDTVTAAGTDTTTAIAGLASHVNGTKNLKAGGSFNGQAVTFTYAGGTCASISCHGAYADVAWTAPTGDCANCHGTFGLSPNGVPLPTTVVAKHSGPLANPDGNENTTLYNLHQGAADLGADGEGRCDYCHANTQPAYTAAMHLDGTIQLNSSMGYQGASGFTGTPAGCTSACHPAATPYQMSDSGNPLQLIAGQGFNCGSCHGDPPATGAHLAHVIGNGDTDRTDCANCHSGAAAYTNDGSPNGLHRNGQTDLFGEWDAATTALGVQWNGGAQTCANACHLNNGTDDSAGSGKVVPAALWTDTSLDCSSCHYYDVQPTGARNAAVPNCQDFTHDRHFGDGTPGVFKVCSDCHVVPPAGDTSHISVPVAVTDGGYFRDRALAERGEATVTRANLSYNGQNAALGAAGSADDGAGPNNRCSGSGMSVGCHATGTSGTADWDTGGEGGCVFCHTNNDPAFNPYTGIHAVTPTVSGVRHDQTLANPSFGPAGCQACHTGIPSTRHHDGTFDATPNAAGNTAIVFASDVGYQDAATPTCSPTGSLVDCHSEGGRWARLWTQAAGATDGTECAGCHGSWAQGWNQGVVHRTDQVTGDVHGSSGSAYQCKDCHALETAGYTFVLGTNDWGGTSQHGNSQITINNAGTSFARGTGANAGQSGCSPCHAAFDGAAPGQHAFVTTVWPLQLVDGEVPPVGCDACHGDGAGRYAPVGLAYPNRAGEHAAHLAQLEAKLGYPAGTVDGVQQRAMCAYCHNDPVGIGGSGHYPPGYTGADEPADVGAFNRLWDGLADAGAVYSAATGTCANLACHNTKSTDPGYNWYDGATATCVMCHTEGASGANPTTGLHDTTPTISGVRHGASFLYNGGASTAECVTCHTATPSSAHLDGTFQPSAPMVQFAAAVGFQDAATPGCSTSMTGCHLDGGAWRRLWHESSAAADGSECVGCHGTWTQGWRVGVTHRTDAGTRSIHGAGNLYQCKDCHALEAATGNYAFAPWSAGRHGNARITLNAEGTGVARGTGADAGLTGCAPCHAAYDGTALGQHSFATTGWPFETVLGDPIEAGCDSCHGDGAGQNWPDSTPALSYPDRAGAHDVHLAAIGTGNAACNTCHPGNPPAGHPDGSVAPARVSNMDTNGDGTPDADTDARFLTLSGATDTDGRYNAVTQTCLSIDCHNNTETPGWYTEVGVGEGCITCHATPPATGAHLAHATSDNDYTDCDACHGDPTRTVSGDYTVGLFGPSGLHNNGVADVYFRYDGDPATAAWNGTTCSNIDCHYNNETPNWTGGTTTCSSCHALPPTGAGARAHPGHYTGKGWATGSTANCTACHPDNTSGHSNVADNSVIVNAALGPAGVAPAITCASAPGLGCHNDHTTPAWNTTGIACTACHTPGGTAAADPATGLHHITAAGPQPHGDTLPGGGCTACHDASKPATHADGVFDPDNSANTDRFLARTNMTFTDGAANTSTCSGTGLVGCHTDGGAWARLWSTEADSAATAPRSARCNVCHGQWASIAGSAGWREGTTHYKAGGTNAATNARGAGHEPSGSADCNGCHVYGAAGNGRHNVPTGSPAEHRITANTNSSGYARSDGNAGCSFCHGGATDAAYNFPVSVFANQPVSGDPVPAPACTDCHGLGGSADFVTSASSHTRVTRGAAFGDCTDCHSGHANGSPGANEVEISTRSTVLGTVVPTMNREYASHGSRFRLGGSATKSGGWSTGGATEAEICWGCHDAQTPAVTEWETNQKPNTGNLSYDYGSLYTTVTGTTQTSNWTTAFWRSGKGRSSGGASNPFWYKRGAIQSTHSVNFDQGTAAVTAGNSLGYNRTETKDSVANIRCSYCHDVHGTHDGVAGDPGGLPYLRGTWKGNPYPEDGAPQWGMANWTVDADTTLTFGRVPRASAASNNSGLTGVPQAGGWWIDQNSGNPNSGATLASTAGLCIQCHGSNVDTLDRTTGENLWVSGGNGHMNAVIGGSGTTLAAHNIYTRAKRGSNQAVRGSSTSPNVDMGVATESGRGYTYRSNETDGYRYYPRIATTSATGTGTTRPYSFRYFPWSAAYNSAYTRGSAIASGTMEIQVADLNSAGSTTVTEAASYSAQSRYHTFNCGKCHNPHASRLPKLLITNCLDTNHNTWDNNYQAAGAIGSPWAGTRVSQWAAAINCHRLDDRAVLSTSPSTVRGPGWNKVSPWLEYTSPDTQPSANPNP